MCPLTTPTKTASCAYMNSRDESSHSRMTRRIVGTVAGRYGTHSVMPSDLKMYITLRVTAWCLLEALGSRKTRRSALRATEG